VASQHGHLVKVSTCLFCALQGTVGVALRVPGPQQGICGQEPCVLGGLGLGGSWTPWAGLLVKDIQCSTFMSGMGVLVHFGLL
jgi:hypothetical protein